MVPDRFATQLPVKSEVLHDYQRRLLIRVPEGSGPAIDERYASALEDTRYLKYRSWQGLAEGNDPADLPEIRDGYFVLALVGPMDPQWRAAITSHNLKIVDHVNPYGLVVRGDSAAVQNVAASLQTSRGYRVITQAMPLPDASRTAPKVAEWLTGRTDASELGFRTDNGQPLVRIVFHADVDFSFGDALVSEFLEPGPDFFPGGSSGQYRASASALSTLLEQVPEVAFVHGVYPKELHNNIGPLEHITNIEPVWTDLGYIGTGLIAGINDSGVDEEHADFPPGTILATQGAMSGTDNGHGTHVSGTVAGRGAAASPTNTSSCGDVSTPLPDARGMAHGAQIVHNNLFDGGVTDEAAMMQWQFQQGAVINNNSWGYGGFGGPATDYGAETVAVDAAVREAEAGVDSQMAIVFSAGNSAEAGISKPGNGKNVITVGASQNDRCGSYIPSQCTGPDIDGMACFSSHGPTQGRNKPDIVAPGTDVLSTGSSDPEATWGGWDQAWTGEEYAIVPGTSMSAPMVTGAATVFMEAYQDLHGDLPSPALVKAALINTATSMGGDFPSNIQGWGRLNLRKAIEGPVEDGIVFFDQDEVNHLATSESWTTEISVGSADEPVRISLVWTDPPGSAGCDPCHVNDLDLIVTAPDGTIYRGNQFSGAWSEPDAAGRDEGNNVENVYVELPAPGNWQVEVNGLNVAELPPGLDGQDFALVATGDFGGISIEPAAVQACTAVGSTDFTITLSGQFEGTTDLAASGLPAGTTGSFNPNPVVFPDEQSVFTLSDLGLASGGDYTIQFTATDAGDPTITADGSAELALYEAAPGQPNPLTPADAATDVDLQPAFTWDEPSESFEYQIQVATDSGFTSVVIDETVATTEFIPADELATGTDYFWRVRSVNACGDGAWSTVFGFQTRFEPIADITPESMTIEVAPDATADDILSISNTGTGDLVWEIGTDMIESAGAGSLAMDPALDETFDLGDFTLLSDASTPPETEFQVTGGQMTRGDVVGFSFSGFADPGGSWASDTCMIIEAPDGTTFGVGGFSDYAPNCGSDFHDAPWDFQGSGSTDPGVYESEHLDVFDPPLADEGTWTITFLNGWTSSLADDIVWEDVQVTLHKQPLPVCIEGEMTTVPWLSAAPTTGTTAAGSTDDVTVTVDATGMSQGQYEGYLCVGSNSADGATMIPVPVVANVNDPNIGVLEGTVETSGYCQADPGPVANATVTVTGSLNTYQTTTDGDGFYSIEIPVDENPVDITASGTGYLDSQVTGVNVDGSGVITQDFELLTDSPCATIAPESFDFELVLGNTDSGFLTFGNADGNVDLEWSVEDYTPASQDATRAMVLLEEDFEGTFPPADWSTVEDGGACPWLSSDDYPLPGWTATSRGAAIDTDDCGSGTYDSSLVSPSLDLTALSAALLEFDLSIRPYSFGQTDFYVEASADGGATWSTLEVWDDNSAVGYPGDPVPVEINLSAYAGEPDVQLRWRHVSGWDYWSYIDNVTVGELPPSCENPNNVPWLDLSPATGATAPGNSDDVSVSILTAGLEDGDYEATICATTNDSNLSQAEIPVSLTVHDPELGSLTGQVFSQTCSADPVPLGGAELIIEGSNGGVFTTQADASGNYFIKVHQDESPVSITGAAADHVDTTVSGVTFEGLDVITTDLTLPTEEACAEVAPEDVSFSLDADDSASGIVELSNVGHARLDWSIDTAEGGYAGFDRPDPASANPADKRPQASDVIISSGDVELTKADLQNVDSVRNDGPTLSVDGVTGGDAYDSGDPYNSRLTLDIGEGNALIGIGWEVTIEAFDPSWLDDARVAIVSDAGDSTGLFLRPGAGVQTPGIDSFSSEGVLMFDDVGIDPIAANQDGTLYFEWHETWTDFSDAPDAAWSDPDSPIELPPGLRLICEDQQACDQAVLGDPIIACEDPAGISWLSVDPAFGVTHVGETSDLNVELDATGLQPGDYLAGLCVASNDPVEPMIAVPVALNVRTPGDWATIEGTVESLGYCSDNPGPIEAATVEFAGVNNTYTTQTDVSGAYEFQLPASEGPVDVTASDADHLAATESGVGISAGTPVEVNFSLTQNAGCTNHDPASYDVTLVTGDSTSEMLTLNNAGAAASTFDVTSAEQSVTTLVELQRQGRDARTLGEGSRAQSIPGSPASQREVEVSARAEITALVVSPDGEAGDPLPPTNLVDALNSFPDVTADLFTDPVAGITVADLEPYDVVLTTNNNRWSDASGDVSVGDALADYVDQGGKLVLFNFVFDHAGWQLAGRYINEGYGPFEMATGDATGSVSMNILDPSHPVFEGVSSLSSDTIRIAMQPDPEAELIAEWSDGEALIAHNDHTVAFNALYSADGADTWTGDLDLMAYNAAQFIAGGATGDPAPWLSFAPETGTVPVDGSSDVSVTFDANGLAAGSYMADVLVNLDEGGEEGTTLSIPATMQVLDPAAIDVNPTLLTAVLEDGDTDLQSFNIANSGEATLDWSIDDTTAGCEIPDWASIGSLSGSLETGNDEDVDVTFDATGLEAGVYDATVCVDSNDPDNPVVEVSLELTVDETLATVEGSVMSLGYCSDNPFVAANAGILIEGQSGTYSGSADGSGFYQIDVPADETPVDMTASHGGHITGMISGVALVAGETSTVDIDLVLEAPCADITPASLSFTMAEGDASESFSIDNSGGAASLNWTLESGTGCYDAAVDTWLTLSSAGDTVGASSSQAVDVTADATGMDAGQYTTQLCISTSDEQADEFSIPVELNVQGEMIFYDGFEMDDVGG